MGCELAQVFARFGVDVTMVDPSPRLLSGGEPEASATVQRVFEEDRIRVLTGRRPLRVQHQKTTRSELFEVDLDTGQRLSGERLLVATGRTPNLDDIGMDTIGLPAGRLSVDEYLRVQGSGETTWLWAIGDVTGHGAFTHVSMYQAGIVIRDILHQDPRPAEYHAVPSVTFTDPEVASVGLTATQATEAGLDIRTGYADLTQSSRGITHDLQHGFVKLVEHDGRLVGATVVGPAAGEVCSMLTLAVHARIPVEKLTTMIYAYPTFHRAIEAALASIPQR